MFERLNDGFNGLFRKLSGQSSISERNVRDAMDEVRTALLEADVHYEVVNAFCDAVIADAIGEEVVKSVKPGQAMIGIVHRRLVEFLGGEIELDAPGAGLPSQRLGESSSEIMKVSPGPTIVMMCGLQGSGKTTTCGKLAARLKKQGRSVMLCAADLQRPAAVEQLETVAKQAGEMSGGARVVFYGEPDKTAAYGKAVGVAVDVCRRALKEAQKTGVDVLILDTAGRLHINDELMDELHKVNRALTPHHIFLVVDAMTGQDAINSAKAFHERLEVDGIILTKFDSDTRGGAALSVKHVTGAPIRYIGVGEKLDAIEPFHAERMAGRVLGMGDVVSLVEKAQQEVSEEEAARLEAKMAKGELTMDDFLKQLKSIRKMGPLKQLMGMLPGMGQVMQEAKAAIDDKHLDKVEATIGSMTVHERRKPDIINSSRRRRIAGGSGATDTEVGQLVKQFGAMSKLMKAMAGGGLNNMAAMREAAANGGLPGMPGAGMLRSKGSTASGPISQSFKKRKPAKKRKK